MKKALILLLIAVLLLPPAACSAGDEAGVTTIKVGTGNDYPPFCYLDDSGALAGYEIALLKAVDKKLPQYKFKYEILEFKTILTALDQGRVDLAAHQFGPNAERKEKYLFGTVGYFSAADYIVVDENTQDIDSLDDLAGKKVSVAPASNWALLLETYNKEHPGSPIDILYYESTPDVLVGNLSGGVIDATLLTESDLQLMNTFLGTKFKAVGKSLSTTETFHIYNKDSVELQTAIDGVLKEMQASGELAALSKKAVDDFFAAAKK
ncbi:MAG: transporter substrate-binding domain-containing protein [Oscillospiraceae bacterium]|jgi:L-cystine transport system substrate-binding protein|nr:transporter substrate-binding domain-containing protein [Oscillospiraceae bacterium]